MCNRTYDRKSHANKTPKFTPSHGDYDRTGISGRLLRKIDALNDANYHSTTPLSKSLLDLLPQHGNNTQSAISTALHESSPDIGVLYSYDRSTTPGNAVDLGGLVELAEKKWVNEQTERMVKGEYEVLDNEGETTVLASSGKGKGRKGSPKQKAAKTPTTTAIVQRVVDEDDDFELI